MCSHHVSGLRKQLRRFAVVDLREIFSRSTVDIPTNDAETLASSTSWDGSDFMLTRWVQVVCSLALQYYETHVAL